MRHWKLALIICAVCVAAYCLRWPRIAKAATNYYVRTDGNDSNTGLANTSGAAWLTIQKCADTLVAGDTCNVNDGTYTRSSNQIVSTSTSGSAGNRITYKSINKWGAKLNGNARSVDGFWLEADYITIQDFEIYGTIDYVGSGCSGIAAYNSDYIQIIGNKIRNIGNTATTTGNGQDGIYLDNFTNATIEKNLIYEIGRTTATYNLDHGIYLNEGSTITMKNNIIYDCLHGWSIQVYGASMSNIDILNNTFAGANTGRMGHVVIITTLSDSDISNNISYDPNTGLLRDPDAVYSNVTANNNLIYDGLVSCNTPPAGITFSGNIPNTDPDCVDAGAHDYHLTSSSPAIGAGLTFGTVTEDYDATVRPQGASYDIGAFEFPEGATTFYVDSAITDTNVASATPDFTAYDHTTFATTGGADSVYKTIADINACTFNPGDTILFRKGQTWREQLTVPSSGSAGLPITFGAYGSGAKPIISGADIITSGASWSADTGTSWQTDANTVGLWKFNQNLNDSSANGYNLTDAATLTYSNTGALYDYYGIFDGSTDYASYTDTGNYFDFGSNAFTVEVTFRTDETNPLGQAQWLVMKSNGSNTVGYGLRLWATTPTWIYPTCYMGDGTHTVYHNLTGNPDAGDNQWHTLSCVFDAGGTVYGYWDGVAKGSASAATIADMDNAVKFTIGAESDGGSKFWGDITEVRVSNTTRADFVAPVAGSATLWSAAVTTEPKTVMFDTTWGTKVASKALVNSANKWYWAANVLWIYSATDPDTAYTSPGIQVGVRDHAVIMSSKDYVQIQDLDLQCGNLSVNGTLQLEGSGGTVGVNNVLTDLTVHYGGGAGVLYVSAGNDNMLKDSEITSNATFGINVYTTAAADNPTTGHPSYIQNNNVHNNLVGGGIEIRGNYYIVENNIVADNAASGEYIGLHIYSGGVGEGTGDYNIFRYNIVSGTIGAVTDGAGIEADEWCDNNQIYYNISHSNAGGGILLYNAASNVVYNNTLYNNCLNTTNSYAAEIGMGGALSTKNIVTNNIGYAVTAGKYAVLINTDSGAGNSFTNNEWYRASGNWYNYKGTAGATLATWNAYAEVGTDLNSDPAFVTPGSDFHLQSSSPCINAGTNVGLTQDYDGVAVSVPPEMGAYEYTGTGGGGTIKASPLLIVEKFIEKLRIR